MIPLVTHAQYYQTGQDPAALKWMQIRTPAFRVIYPASYGTAGIDFAKSLEQARSNLASLYPEKRFRIPVIIHNYTTESNGYVAWAPDRMEIYPTPEQNTIPLDANRQLALHELTHVLQMESLNKGFTRAMSVVFGQQFTGIVSSLLPLWFLEGDAVFSETVLTRSGRGRAPSFQKELKALILENGSLYKYDKMFNGSYRNYVPDFYQTGFQMMAWSYSKYNRNLWERALDLTGREPFIINPVNFSLRRSASLTKKRLFTETFDTLKAVWSRDESLSGSRSYKVLNPSRKDKYAGYYSPVMAGHDSIIAVKTSLTDPPRIVLINPSEGSEKVLCSPGRLYPYFISFAKGKIVWVESHTDPRWDNRGWSVIKILDLGTKIRRQLARKTRYMAASISPDGNYIAAVENTIRNENNLVILDSWSGERLQSAPAPGNAALQRPQWDESGKNLTVISLTEKGEGIISYNSSDHTWATLIENGFDDLQSSFLRNDSLFFISSSSGTDNVFLLTPDKKRVPVTNSKFGANDLNVSGNNLLFADYSSKGNNICSTSLSEKSAAVTLRPETSSFLINRFNEETGESDVTDGNSFSPEPYRKWKHLFRFHSWMPFYADLETVTNDPASVKPGLLLVSQNDLSTLISTFGYEYSENRHKFHYSIKWNGWYFNLESRLDYGLAPVIQKFVRPGSPQEPADPANIRPGYQLTNRISLPLQFRGGYFTQYLFLSASSMLKNEYLFVDEKNRYDVSQNELTGRVYFSNYGRQAVRDIYPRWAQVIDASYSYYPFDTDLYGDLSTIRSAFYFPGFLRNQGIRLRLEAEKQNTSKFILGNRISVSRSYSDILSDQAQFLSGDYFTPLLYPDLNVAALLYLTRIRADLFYDFTSVTGRYVGSEHHNYRETFRSFGIELLGDFYLFRIPFMISSGIQAAWRDVGEMPYVGLLFNIDLFGMNIGKKRL